MVNKLFMDLAKCAELSGHGSVNEHREIVPLIANDKRGYQREVIADKCVDLTVEQVPEKINKIYDAFCSKPNQDFWNKKILAFEYLNNVDMYILLSYLYMINEGNDANQRSIKTATDAAAILCKIDIASLEKDAGFDAFVKQAEVQEMNKTDNLKDKLEFFR